MKARIVRIGNSQGVRLPRPLLAEAGLSDEVELSARDGAIVISRAKRPRAGWRDAAKRARETGADRLLDDAVPNRFDDDEWKW
jgi:antitoxin MazE